MKSRILEQYEKMDDFEKITFDKLVKRCGKLYGEKIALKDLTERITYSELQKESEKIAQKLIGLGIRNSNIVLLQCINTVFFVKVLFGLLNLGAIPVLVLPAHREVEIIKMLEKTNAVAYIAPKEYMGFEYSNIEKKVKEYFPEIICLNEQSFDKEALDDIPIRENGIEIEYDDVALLLLSGGTTGEPKLIPRTHADYIYNAKKAAERSEMDKESVYLASMPMSHNMTLSSPGILGTLYMGGTVVMCSIPSPDDILETIERERVTITSLVPAVATLCVELLELDSFDISSVKTVIIGGARMEEKLAKNIDKFQTICRQIFRWIAENDPDPVTKEDRCSIRKTKYGIGYDYDSKCLRTSSYIYIVDNSFALSNKRTALELIETFKDELIWLFTEFEFFEMEC